MELNKKLLKQMSALIDYYVDRNIDQYDDEDEFWENNEDLAYLELFIIANSDKVS